MGALGCLCHLCFFRVLPVLVVVVSVFIGWLCSTPCPEGTFFGTIFPLMGGFRPATIFGSYQMPAVVEVPDDLTAAARPAGEMFLQLPSSNMPANGIGMCCRPGAYDPESVRRNVLWYLLQGGRHIDDADAYWNHQAVGLAIRQAQERGVPRSEVFLTTKLLPSFFGKELANASVHRFLQELGLDYIDLVLLHAPSHPLGRFGECKEKTWKQCRAETWLTLSNLREQGYVRDIGVSNFPVRHMEEIQSLKAAPIAANQIEYHPWATDWQHNAFKFCNQHGIAVTAYNSVGGFLQKAKPETVQTMKAIAATKEKTIPLVLLRWALQKNISVIPGTSNPKHMRENLDVYGWELTDTEMDRLDALRTDPNRITYFGVEEDST